LGVAEADASSFVSGFGLVSAFGFGFGFGFGSGGGSDFAVVLADVFSFCGGGGASGFGLSFSPGVDGCFAGSVVFVSGVEAGGVAGGSSFLGSSFFESFLKMPEKNPRLGLVSSAGFASSTGLASSAPS
jgi:hypothetical protein